MPKVTPEYIENKKKLIVDAVLAVCKRKTLSSITMQDIINESGLSQGGIYRFYTNIDEILAALLDRVRQVPQMSEAIDRLFTSIQHKIEFTRAIQDPVQGRAERRKLIREVAVMYHQMMADTMKNHLFPYLKIEFEYNIFITDYPERAKKIYASVRHPFALKEAMSHLASELVQEIEYGTITPLVSMEEYFAYNSAVYDGILKRALSRNCYERDVMEHADYEYDIDKRFQTMCISSCHLLGLDEED